MLILVWLHVNKIPFVVILKVYHLLMIPSCWREGDFTSLPALWGLLRNRGIFKTCGFHYPCFTLTSKSGLFLQHYTSATPTPHATTFWGLHAGTSLTQMNGWPYRLITDMNIENMFLLTPFVFIEKHCLKFHLLNYWTIPCNYY